MSEQTNTADIEDAGAHTAVQLVVRAVQTAFWDHWDVRTAWPLLDPLLRRVWVQHWLSHLDDGGRALGDRDELLAGLTVATPKHRWWGFFEASAVELLAGLAPADIMAWGISAEPHVLGLDLELLALWPVPACPTDPVSADSPHVPMLMRFEPNLGWRLLNFMSAAVPEPGWPPTW